MSKKRMATATIAGLLLVASIFTGCGKNTEKYSIGTGGEGGSYYGYGVNLAEELKEESDISLDVKTTAGSAANLRLISQGYLDFAMVQSDIYAAAVEGTGSFDGEPLSGFHSVTGLYTEAVQIVATKESGITSIEDLQGKTVSLGAEDSGVLQNALQLLNICGISEKNLKPVYQNFASSAERMKNGELDAFFVTAGAPTAAIVSLAEEMEITIIPISETISKRLLESNSAYCITEIPAGTYAGQEEAIPTVGVSAVLIAADTVSSDAEQAVLALLQKQNEELQAISFGVAVEEKTSGRLNLSLDMYMTLALAVGMLYLGMYLRKRIKFLETFCIPAPVIGGLLFAIVSCLLYVTGTVQLSFDETLKNICMIIFFTSVGFQANLKVLKQGGVSLIVFLISVFVLIVCQNGLAVGVSKLLGIEPFIGLCTGSIPMVGGHGTAGAFGLVLEDLGLEGATTLCTAAATFGLIMGSLMGGPIGRRLILKHDLMKTVYEEDASVLIEDEQKHQRHVSMYAPAAYQIAIAMGIGTIVSMLLSKTGMTFPVYIGAMIVAAVMRNVGEYSGKFTIHMGEINDLGGICLSLFLGIAMITLKLWQLADLALPLIILLLTQTIFMAIFAYFVVYNIMGRDYDAAVLSAGTCGFGMGATPNAMANMQALTDKFAPSVKAYLLVPIVGSMFADFINSLVITFFINLF